MNKRYLILLIFVVLQILSFNKYGKKLKQFISIIIFYLYSQFNGIYSSIYYKITKKNFIKHPLNLTKILRTNLNKINYNQIKKDKCIYLFNHRSWADFWLDYDIVGGNAAYISRNIIKMVLGTQSFMANASKNIIFFNRDESKNRFKLYNKILDRLKIRNIILYPEGTRNTKDYSLPLKFGVIKLAYENNVPLQIIICKNKEKVFSLKKMEYNKNINCPYYVSKVIYPENFEKLDIFIKYIQNKWNESWNKIYK